MEPDSGYLECSLKDCGFEEAAAAQYIRYAEENRTADLLRLLNRQRKKLMENLHTAQKRVDTVDFMIRSVEQIRREMGMKS